jgi:hypothetical protein
MSRVRTRLEQYKTEIENKSQYKHGLPGSTLNIVNTLLNDLEQDEKENGWIPVSERLPEEHDSIFAKFKGTDNWKRGMFEKTSKYVIATVVFDDGTVLVEQVHTTDGIWRTDKKF